MENRGGGAAATGCYKCGRPGHWSRDCPSHPNIPNPNNSNNSTLYPSFKTTGGGVSGASKPAEKPNKVPRLRPKLTPELLLSDDGLGYVLRHFPHALKYRGRAHVFVNKVEQVGATKRVRICIRELRERVANGGDPTKLHEPHGQHDLSINEQDVMNLEEPSLFEDNTTLSKHNTDDMREDLLDEIYTSSTEEPCQTLQSVIAAADVSLPKEAPDNIASHSTEIQISEEQKARMEANRLKAMEKAAGRARSLQAA